MVNPRYLAGECSRRRRRMVNPEIELGNTEEEEERRTPKIELGKAEEEQER